MQQLRDNIARTTSQLGTMRTAEQELRSQINSTNRELQNQQSAAQQVQSAAANMGDVLKANLWSSAIQSAVSRLVSSLKSAAEYCYNVGSSFEAGMSQVAAISGATASELDQLTAKAKELGASTKFTATETAQAMNYMAIRCIPDNEIAYAAANQNADTIHIEVCYKQKSGRFEEKSIAALEKLVRSLMAKFKIPAAKVLRHYDLTGKLCPAYYVDENRWAALHERITSDRKSRALYRVQVGAFGSKDNAEAYAAKIKQAGFNAYVVQVK